MFIMKNLHVDEMRNIVSPIQHWSVDERLSVLYEDLLNAQDVKIEKGSKQKVFSSFENFTFSISGLFVHKAGLGPLYQPITWQRDNINKTKVPTN